MPSRAYISTLCGTTISDEVRTPSLVFVGVTDVSDGPSKDDKATMIALEYIPFEEATAPRDGVVWCDYWWIYFPDRGLAVCRGYGGATLPQCNRNKLVAETIAKRLYPGAQVIQVPAVYLGHWEDK